MLGIKLFLALAFISILAVTSIIDNNYDVTFSGTTLPEKKVYVKIDNLPERTSIADKNGNFKITISDLSEGMHQANFYVRTHQDKVAKEINFPFSVPVLSPETLLDVSLTNIDLTFEEMGNPDLNYDGEVNIRDVSIMMHFWTE